MKTKFEELTTDEMLQIDGGYYYVWGMRFTNDGKPAPTWNYIQGQLGGAFVNSLHY